MKRPIPPRRPDPRLRNFIYGDPDKDAKLIVDTLLWIGFIAALAIVIFIMLHPR